MRLRLGAMAMGLAWLAAALAPHSAVADSAVPQFQSEPFWPKPLPGNWILGQVGPPRPPTRPVQVGIDSKGNLYTAEVGWGRRAQKFRRVQ